MSMQNSSSEGESLLARQMEALEKQMRLTRIFCILSVSASVLLLLVMFLIFLRLKPLFAVLEDVSASIGQISQSLEQLDLEAINDMMSELDVEGINETIASLDVEGINEVVASVDTKQLSDILDHLSKVTETLQGISEKFKAIPSAFGIGK